MQELAPFLNLGLQLAITIGLFCYIGYKIDEKYNTSPIWIVSLSLFGIAAGMFNFLWTVLKHSPKKNKK